MNNNIKILLVNNNSDSDNQAIAEALSRLKLSNVVAVNSSKSALREYVKEMPAHPFDVIFISELSDKDEMELLKGLVEINNRAYVVMLVAEISADKVLNFIRSGASGVLSQPFNADKIRLELEKYSLLREDKIAS